MVVLHKKTTYCGDAFSALHELEPESCRCRIAGWLVVMEVCLGLAEQYREAIGGAVGHSPVEIALRKGAKCWQVAVEEYGHALCGCRIVLPTGHNNDYDSHSDVLQTTGNRGEVDRAAKIAPLVVPS